MARYDKCIDRIMKAAGRQLKPEQVEAVFSRINKAALDLKAGRKPSKINAISAKKIGIMKHQGPAMDNIVIQAAQTAMVDMVNDAAAKMESANLQVLKLSARMGDYKALRDQGVAPMDVPKFMHFRSYKGDVNLESTEQRITGVRSMLLSKVMPMWEALGDDMTAFFTDRQKTVEMVKAMRGEKTDDSIAKRAGEVYVEGAELARTWFNENGGKIGKRSDWGGPQHHSQARAAEASLIATGKSSKDPEVNKKIWVDAKMKVIDPEKYIDETGRPMSEAGIRNFLGIAWESISTNGVADLTPGKFNAEGNLGNRHSEHREIHYKDAESVVADWEKWGEKSFPDILYEHMDTMARDIALIERMGPNDKMTWQSLLDTAYKEAVSLDRSKEPQLKNERDKLQRYYDHSVGRTKGSANFRLSNIADGIGHLNTAAKGGGFAIASLFGDRVPYQAVAHMNNLPLFQDWTTQLSLLNPANAADRLVLRRNGLMLDTLRSGVSRYWDELSGTGAFSQFTGKLASGVMKITGMSAINAIPKGAFELGLGDAIGQEIKAGKTFDTLHESDVRTLKHYGITKSDWDTWKLASLTDMGHGNDAVLLSTSIAKIPDGALIDAGLATDAKTADLARRNAVVKLLGAINTEAEFAIISPGMYERAQFYSNLQRGTVVGTIGRAVLQFKQFPWTMLQRSFDLLDNSEGPVAKATMAAYLIVATTLAGAMIMQTREVLSGKDPRKMLNDDYLKFWGAAFLQGGALGIYGDFLYSANKNRYGSGILEAMAGPTVGPALDMVVSQPMAAINAKMEGRESHLAAQTVQDLKGFVPGGNLWYAKAALDRLIWHSVFETLSPGYLANMRSRTMKDFRQDWYAPPGEWPERSPDLAGAFR